MVGLHIGGQSKQLKIVATFDGVSPIGIDDCANISRKLNDLLSETLLTETNYVLEISSPGADKPLLFPKQYHKHIGRELEITKKDQSKAKGRLKSVDEEKLSLEFETVKKENNKKVKNTVLLEIPFSEIIESVVIISFS